MRKKIERRLEMIRERMSEKRREIEDVTLILEGTEDSALIITYAERRRGLTLLINHLHREIAFLEGLLE